MSQEQIESLGLHDWQKNGCRLATIRNGIGSEAPEGRTEVGYEVGAEVKVRKVNVVGGSDRPFHLWGGFLVPVLHPAIPVDDLPCSRPTERVPGDRSPERHKSCQNCDGDCRR